MSLDSNTKNEKDVSQIKSNQGKTSNEKVEKAPNSDKEKQSINPPMSKGKTQEELSEKSHESIQPIIDIALKEVEQRKHQLENEINDLLKRKLQLEKELKSSFNGQSDAIARRVKGFQEYLVGALQDLSQSAEQLELIQQPLIVQPSPLDETEKVNSENNSNNSNKETIPAISDTFRPDEKLIRNCFAKFLEQPEYYADPWKLRRSLEPKDINLLEDWFFNMGGRGAQPSSGNRSKNILIAAGLIAIIGELYGDQFQTLILASQPERLGDWRRGLQDALGLSREDFGPNSGIVLFERADGLIERADRLEGSGDLPLIIIDAAEISVDTPILQFPIWLAFAASAEELYEEEDLLL